MNQAPSFLNLKAHGLPSVGFLRQTLPLLSFHYPLRMLFRYLANLTLGRMTLWCYFIWYLVVLVHYFDRSGQIWLTSLGLSVIIGIALVINTTRSGVAPVKLEPWPTFRLFLTPFCVSSFAALVKGKGFFLIFSPDWRDLAIGGGLCGILCLTARLLARRLPGQPGADAVHVRKSGVKPDLD